MADNIEELDLVPPKTAQDNAQKVLDWRDEHGDEVKGMTRTGWVRANQLSKGEELSPEIVKKMAQFNRHRQNSDLSEEYEGEPWKDAGYVAWLGWGGDTGVDWAIRMSERIESIENTGMDKITTLSHKHVLNDENENTGMEKNDSVENSAIGDRITDNSADDSDEPDVEDIDSNEISKNTYNGYFEGKEFDNDDWRSAVNRLREIYGSARSFMTRIVKHEQTGHGRGENVPVFEEPIDSDTIEQFAKNVEGNVDEETFERVVEDMNTLDNVVKRLFFRMIMHDDYMHDRDDFEVEQLLSSSEEELQEYDSMQECMDYHVGQEGYSRDQAYAMCADKMDLSDEELEDMDVEEMAEPGGVSEGDKVRWDSSGGTAYGEVDTVTTEGTVSAEPEGPDMEGSEDEPAYKVQVYDLEDEEWTGTETYVVHRADALTVIDDFPDTEENSETLSQGMMPTHQNMSEYSTQESDDWSRPKYEEFKENYDLEGNFADLSEDKKRMVAAHFGRVDASSYDDAVYSDLQLPHHSPSGGDVQRSAVMAARQRLPQSDMPQGDLEEIDTHLSNHLRNDFDEEDVSPIIERENSDLDTEEETYTGREIENGQLVSYGTDYGRSYGRVKELTSEDKYVVEVYSAKLGGGWSAAGEERVLTKDDVSKEGKLPQSMDDVFNTSSNAEAQTVQENSDDDMESEEVENEDEDESSEQLSPAKVQQVGKKVRSVAEVLSDDSLEGYLERNDLDYSADEFRDLIKDF